MVIRILDHVQTASTYDDGEVIFHLLKDELERGQDASLSFDGIRSVPSAFVNSALVRLLEVLPFEQVKSHLRIEDSTRSINELVRSRFEFASGVRFNQIGPGQMKQGVYHVRFVSTGRDVGEGIAVIKGGAVNGGDHGYVYTGEIAEANNRVAVQLHIKRWNKAVTSVFGPLEQFDLTLAGAPDDAIKGFRVEGNITGSPNHKISIVGRFISPVA